MANSLRLPTIFISHGGGPWPFMTWDPPHAWDKMGAWLRNLAATLPHEPKAILAISGHWETSKFTVNTAAHPSLLYDYSGFPDETYHLKYDAPGSPALANSVAELLKNAGLSVGTDPHRGFDHGVFVPFSLIYPKAEIPIVQLSIREDFDPASHFLVGRALKDLRDQGVLIVGSGLTYHNMRGFGERFGPVSEQFDSWLTETVSTSNAEVRRTRLLNWSEAPAARKAHPREDHLVPLFVVAGAAGEDAGKKIFSDRIMGVTMSGYQFG